MRRILTVTLCLAVLLAATAALAQSTDSTTIDQRAANQQARIQQGIASGQLSPAEAGRLENQEGRIAAQEDRMKADGNLSPKERAKLTREQNRESKRIYREKHDAQTAQNPAGTNPDQRAANQQKRIQQGIASGQLTPKEANRLERQEGRIAAQENRMKADGNFTPAERAKLNREQNRESKRIYRQKHDAQTTAPKQ